MAFQQTKTWTVEFENSLLSASNYRDFLNHFFNSSKSLKISRAFTYQEFAKRAGFASKSYMADILAKRKRLSPKSIDQVAKGLKLSEVWKKYFYYLVMLEEDPSPESQKIESYYSKLQRLRLTIIKRRKTLNDENLTPLLKLMLQSDVPQVYSSLGTSEFGATEDEIVSRSGVEREKIQSILKKLIQFEAVTYNSHQQKYIPNSQAISVNNQGNEIFFKKMFQSSLERAKKRNNESHSEQDKQLFMTQFFSVRSDQLPLFKQELRHLITSFAEEAESPDGDCVAEICISFTNNHQEKNVTSG